MNCYEEIVKSYKKFGNNFSFYYFNNKIDIKSFLHDVDVMAIFLQENGINSGDVFTLYLPNCIQSFVMFYALNKIGAISNIVHPLIPFENLKKTMLETNSKGIICLDILINKNIKKLNELYGIIIIAKNSNYIKNFKKPFFKLYEFFKAFNVVKAKKVINYSKIIKSTKFKDIKTTVFETATFIHSGGTSGESKTIKLTNEAICNLTSKLEFVNQKTENSFIPVVLPIFHAFGLVAGVHAPIVQGYNLVIFPKFNAKKINEIMQKNKVETLISVPLMLKKMMQQKNFYGEHLKNLKNIFCGGDFVELSLQKKFNDAVASFNGKAKVMAGYGLTETASVISVNTNNCYKLGSVGKPLQNVNIEIWNDNNEKVSNNVVGEIAVSGKTIMEGYLNSSNSGITFKNNEKYVKTGDMGHFDSEGFLFVDGRKKSMIKIASYNVFPSEIENVIRKLPFIDEVSAFEKTINNKTAIKVVISLKDNNCENVINKIIKHCKKHLIKYSIPSEIQIIKKLPRTQYGKVDYIKISQLYK